MKKRILESVLPAALCMVLFAGVFIPAFTPDAAADPPVEVSVLFEGVEMDMETPSVIINSTTYVPLLEFCAALDPDSLANDGDSGVATAFGMPVSASAGDCYIVANERYLYTPALIREIDDLVYVPLRLLGRVFGLNVIWLADTKTVVIIQSFDMIESGSSFYDDSEVYWMSRIINAEAGGECMEGKIAVGNVIMNRVGSSNCPDTVYDVIFDNKFGVQFTPAYSGAINRSPNQESIIAAKLALEGANVVGDSMYFNVSYMGSWASKNRPYVTTIGNHSFYS